MVLRRYEKPGFNDFRLKAEKVQPEFLYIYCNLTVKFKV